MRKKKNLKALTKLRREEELKHQAAEDQEQLEVLGQESDTKAAKWVMEVQKEEDQKQDQADNLLLDKLDSKKKTIFTYKDSLFQYAVKLKTSYDIPSGFQWGLKSTREGIALFIRDKKGHWFGKGTKVCNEPKYDLNAVQRLIFNGLDFMDRLEDDKRIVV